MVAAPISKTRTMFYRLRRRSLEVLTSRYDSATKRQKQVRIGSIPVSSETIPDSLIRLMTTEEQKECLLRLRSAKLGPEQVTSAGVVAGCESYLQRLHQALIDEELVKNVDTLHIEHIGEELMRCVQMTRRILSRFSRLSDPVVIEDDLFPDDQPCTKPT